MQLLEFEMEGTMPAPTRYGVLDRARRLADRRGIRCMGFDLRRQARFLLDGPADEVASLARALKAGTVQAEQSRGRSLYLGATRVQAVRRPVDTLIGLHSDPDGSADPLSTPWTSHRDLLGFRHASFFDAGAWRGQVDPRWLHLRCGGWALPDPSPHPVSLDLDLPLRVSAAVLGVLPADRRSFRLFSHLARWGGARQTQIASALMLTPRRIRQLQAQPEPRLRTAARAVLDPRLAQVP